jgi:peptidyl-prolyl cis-trans isomerase D
MVKAFEDAVFAAKSGDIVGPVETEFGYHVIRVTGIEAGRTRSFDEVKAEIEQDLKRNRAQAQFAQSADQLQNLVYEQADSLAPAAKALGVEVVQTPLITRSQAQQLALGNAKFVQALFAPDSIQGKRNTDAIEVGPNALMSGRIVEYKAAAPRPFDEVKDEIRRQLVVRGASEMAQKAGREKLTLLEQGKSDKEASVAFGKPVALQRSQTQPGFSPDAVNRIFQADATKLPRYVGTVNDRGGFSIYKVLGVNTPPAGDTAKAELAGTRISEQLGRELVNAYLASLKAKAEVKIDQAALEKK